MDFKECGAEEGDEAVRAPCHQAWHRWGSRRQRMSLVRFCCTVICNAKCRLCAKVRRIASAISSGVATSMIRDPMRIGVAGTSSVPYEWPTLSAARAGALERTRSRIPQRLAECTPRESDRRERTLDAGHRGRSRIHGGCDNPFAPMGRSLTGGSAHRFRGLLEIGRAHV